MKTTATVQGKTVKIGDCVGFKSDIEQAGRITAIKHCSMRGTILTLENKNGFDGGYIGGETVTTERAKDCWL